MIAQVERLVTRAATLDDVDAVVALINAAGMVDTGGPETTRNELLIEWNAPDFNLATDTLLIFGPDGELAGFAELWDTRPHVRHYLWGRVHPDVRDQGIGGHLLDWGEARARQSLPKAPPEARVSLHTTAVSTNQAARELFEERGFVLVRHFLRMVIEMEPGTPPPDPVWPEGVRARPFALDQDARAAHQVIHEAFAEHWGYVEGETFEEWVHWLDHDPAFDPSVCSLAVTRRSGGEEIVGVAMCCPAHQSFPDIAWVDELAVAQAWRRKGIATALLRHTFGEFYRCGRYRVGLGVDADSLTRATRLYENVGMCVFQQCAAFEKVLRPGGDPSAQIPEA